MAATTAVKAGIISAAAGLVLVVGAFAVTSTMAGAQTPTPDTQQQQSTPTTPQDGTTPKAPTDGTGNKADCPGMDGTGGGMRGQRPGAGTTPEDGSTSSGTSFRGARAGGPRI